MEQLGQLEVGGLAHAVEADHAEAGREAVARADAQQDRRELPQALAVVVQGRDHNQREEGHQPVLPGAVVRAAGAAGHIVDGRGIEGQANGEDHGAGNQRREQPPELFDEEAHQRRHRAADDLRPQDGCHAVALGDGLHGGDISEADAHDDRQPRAQAQRQLAEQREELQQRRKRRDHQRRLDQNHLLLRRQPRGTGDNDGRGHAADDHRHHVLHRQRQRPPKGRDALQLENIPLETDGLGHRQPTFPMYSSIV